MVSGRTHGQLMHQVILNMETTWIASSLNHHDKGVTFKDAMCFLLMGM